MTKRAFDKIKAGLDEALVFARDDEISGIGETRMKPENEAIVVARRNIFEALAELEEAALRYEIHELDVGKSCVRQAANRLGS